MKLADDIKIQIGGEVIELRPSLRFAMQLERRPGSFAGIMREVAEESLTAACEIIRPHYSSATLPTLIMVAGLSQLKLPLLAYVLRCAGIEDDVAPAEGTAKGQTVSIEEQLTRLYRTGTGWLGWTPAQTLDSTPDEIMEAFKGRQEMFRALFGSADKPQPQTTATPDQLAAKMKFLFGARAKKGT